MLGTTAATKSVLGIAAVQPSPPPPEGAAVRQTRAGRGWLGTRSVWGLAAARRNSQPSSPPLEEPATRGGAFGGWGGGGRRRAEDAAARRRRRRRPCLPPPMPAVGREERGEE